MNCGIVLYRGGTGSIFLFYFLITMIMSMGNKASPQPFSFGEGQGLQSRGTVRNFYLTIFSGTLIFFLTSVMLSLLFRKWSLFDSNSRSIESIIFEGVRTSVLFFVLMFIFLKNRVRKKMKKVK
jgi:hypothetical protein